MAQRRQQEGAEAALLPVGLGQPVLLQQPREELLRQVLGIVGLIAAAADVGVEGIPIGLAESGQRRLGAGRVAARRRQHHRPMRRDEGGVTPPGFGRGRSRRLFAGRLGRAHAPSLPGVGQSARPRASPKPTSRLRPMRTRTSTPPGPTGTRASLPNRIVCHNKGNDDSVMRISLHVSQRSSPSSCLECPVIAAPTCRAHLDSPAPLAESRNRT